MKIEYNKIIFNLENVRIILVFLLIYLVLDNLIIHTIGKIEERINYNLKNKYSFEVALNYHRGGVMNPQAFIDNSLIYKNLKKDERELTELKYAKFLLINNNVDNVHNKEMLNYVNMRISEIKTSINSKLEESTK
jgi:hypothetical protein